MKIKLGLTAHLSKNRLFIHKALYEALGRPRKLWVEFSSQDVVLTPSPKGAVVQRFSGSACIRIRSYVWKPGKDVFFEFSSNNNGIARLRRVAE